MKDRERAQIERILTHAVGLFRSGMKTRLRDIYATQAASGRLQSGATIKVPLDAMAENVERMLGTLEPRVRAISAASEALTLLSMAIDQLLDVCACELPEVIRMAGGGHASANGRSVQDAITKLYDEMRADVKAKVGILADKYEEGPEIGANLGHFPNTLTKRGGRPPAEFWDDMWASIAASLYAGGLVPKSQADIERAMTGWIESRGKTAAVSTIRARARRLWDRISLPDE